MSGKENNYAISIRYKYDYLLPKWRWESYRFIDKNLKKSAISSITYLEILVFSYDEEEDKQVREFLELFTIYDVEKKVLDIAIETYRKKKVKMADNLIGSTAKLYNLTLVTRNVDDFKNMELNVLNIYA